MKIIIEEDRSDEILNFLIELVKKIQKEKEKEGKKNE